MSEEQSDDLLSSIKWVWFWLFTPVTSVTALMGISDTIIGRRGILELWVAAYQIRIYPVF